MIAKDSFSYPCLAVSQHFNVPYEDVLRDGGILLNYHLTGQGADPLLMSNLPDDALEQLIANYDAAAKHFKWRTHVD